MYFSSCGFAYSAPDAKRIETIENGSNWSILLKKMWILAAKSRLFSNIIKSSIILECQVEVNHKLQNAYHDSLIYSQKKLFKDATMVDKILMLSVDLPWGYNAWGFKAVIKVS